MLLKLICSVESAELKGSTGSRNDGVISLQMITTFTYRIRNIVGVNNEESWTTYGALGIVFADGTDR